MNYHQSSLNLSSRREKNSERRKIFIWLAWLREVWYGGEPDLSARRREFVDRVDQIMKQKGWKV